MDNETVKWFASLGVGGALGGFIFYFYRKDHIATSTILFNLVRDNTAAMTALTDAIQEFLGHDRRSIRIGPANPSDPKKAQELYEGKDGC